MPAELERANGVGKVSGGVKLKLYKSHHVEHGWPGAELSPAAHKAHSTLPLVVDSRPAGHKKHASPPRLVPTPSAVAKLTYEPAAHSSHSAAPSAPLNVPIGHARHCSGTTAPGWLRYRPIGQLVHAPITHEKQLSTGVQEPYVPGAQLDVHSELIPKSNTVPDAKALPSGGTMTESTRRKLAMELNTAFP